MLLRTGGNLTLVVRNLERDVTEVKSRLNGLLLFIASTALAQVLLRVV